MLTLPANLKQAFAQSGAKPIILAQIYHPAFAQIEVSSNNTDITSIGFTLYSGGVSIATYTITAGVDFTIGASATVTAYNIAEAISDLGYGIRATSSNTRVNIVTRRSYYTSSSGVRSANTSLCTHFSVSLNGADLRKILQTSRNTAAPYLPFVSVVSGDKPFKQYPASIISMSTYGREIDPSTREHSAGTIQLDLVDDGFIRKIISIVGLDNCYVDLYCGEQSLSENDFMLFLRTIINSATPSFSEPLLTLELGDPLDFLRNRLYSGTIYPHHPIRAIEHILYHVNRNILLGNLFDTSSLTIDDVPQSSSAQTVARNAYKLDDETEIDNRISDPTPVIDLLNELILLLDGTLAEDGTGRLYFKELDYAAAAVRTLNVGRGSKQDAVITEMTPPSESIINRVNINVNGGPISATFSIEDPASLAEYGEHFDFELSSPWLTGVARYQSASAEATASTSWINQVTLNYYGFRLTPVSWAAAISGFDGWTTADSVYAEQSDTQYAIENVSDRPAYFLLQGRMSTTYGGGGTIIDGGQSIIKVYRRTYSSSLPGSIVASTEYPAISSHPDQCWVTPVQWLYHISDISTDGFTHGTGGFGTYPLYLTGGGTGYSYDRYSPIYIFDVTSPVWIANRKFRRFRYGCPKLTIEAPLTQADLSIGDVIALSGDERYLTLGRDGISSNATWEVIRTEVSFVGDSPGVTLQLMLLSDSVMPSFDAVYDNEIMQQSRLPSVGLRYIITSDGSRVTADLDDDGLLETYLTMRT